MKIHLATATIYKRYTDLKRKADQHSVRERGEGERERERERGRRREGGRDRQRDQ